MAALSNYFSNAILNNLCRGTAYTFPSTLYVALTTAAPTGSSTGSTITEPSGNAYARVSVTANTSNFSAASAGSISNSAAITFPTATGSWGTVTNFAVCDASTAGNVLFYGTLGASQAITSGMTPSFASSALTLTDN